MNNKMQAVGNLHMFNQTAQNFYNPKDRAEMEMMNHQRNYSTGMKGGHPHQNMHVKSPLAGQRQQIYIPGGQQKGIKQVNQN